MAALDTHCHADHVTGAWLMQQATGCRIGVSRRYGEALQGADLRLDHGDRVRVRRPSARGAGDARAHGRLHHLSSSDDRRMAFTGDCLLIRGAGRCDFQQGHAQRAVPFDHASRSSACPTIAWSSRARLQRAHDVEQSARSGAHNPRIGGAADERDFVGFMENLHLPHPKQLAIAVPANLRSGARTTPRCRALAAWGPVRQTYAGLLEIDPEWVAEHLDDVQVLDVRQREELDEPPGRIAGAQLIPLSELKARVAEVPSDQPVVAVCHAGMRSGSGHRAILRSARFTRVANLRGGMLLWQQLGPAGGASRKSLTPS